MEPLSTIFLFIAFLALIAAWALSRAPADPLDAGDMGPESILNHAKPADRTISIDMEFDAEPMLAQMARVQAAVDRLVEAQKAASIALPVLDVPPVRLPAPAPQPKRRRKPRPQPKRETKPDTRKVERKGW